MFRRRDGDEDARKRLQRVSLLGRPLARSVGSFRSGSVRSARRRGFGATTKERLEHRGRLRGRYRRSVTGRRPERRRAALAFAGRHVLGKAELRVRRMPRRARRARRRARALARAQLSERVGPEREHLARARDHRAVPVRRGDVHRERVAKRARYQTRGPLVRVVSAWYVSCRTGRRRFRVAVRVARVVPEPAVRAASPGEHGAAPRDRERVVLPRGDADDEVFVDKPRGDGKRHGRRRQRGDVAVVHFRVVHAEPPASAVPPATHRPVAQRHHRVELGGVERNNAAADAGEAVDAARRRHVVAASVAELVVHARAPRVQEPLRALGIALGTTGA